MTTSNAQTKTYPPTRLVLIIPGHGVVVYEGRKPLAVGHGTFEIDAKYIEEIRTAEYKETA